LILGPSVAAHLPGVLRAVGVHQTLPAPFDRGVLNPTVIGQLSLLDGLAVALIALTAGGELKLDAIRRGLRLVLRIIAAQTSTIILLVGSLALAICGLVPELTLPGLEEIPHAAIFPLAALIAAVSLSASPAATIAVINETRSE